MSLTVETALPWPKAVGAQNVRRLAALAIVSLAVAGCSKQANTQDIYLQLDGQTCYFPVRFYLDGKQWERSSEGPEEKNSQLICAYQSENTDQWVTLSYLHGAEKATWVINECEKSPHGMLRWKENRRDLLGIESGLIVMHGYEKGGMHGPMKWYYPNGKLKLDGYANLTVQYGPASGYYEDGTLCWSGQFKRGAILPQQTRCFDRNGDELPDLTVNEVLEHYKQWIALDTAEEELPWKLVLQRIKL